LYLSKNRRGANRYASIRGLVSQIEEEKTDSTDASTGTIIRGALASQ
jgi:hypothetical protein